MSENNLLAKVSSLGLFYRWHPEVALRYLPVVKEINKCAAKTSVLEIGSGGLGIAPYLKREVTGVDIHFSPPYHPLLKKVIGIAQLIPFKDNSFDIVISVDMLEHIKKEERETAIGEMMRVVRRKIIIVVPCGKEAQRQDQILSHYSRRKAIKKSDFLEEHLKHGIPAKEEIVAQLQSAARRNVKRVKITIKGNENTKLHHFLMKGYFIGGIINDIFYRKILLLAIPLMRMMNKEPTYRKIFIVEIL